jgi:hypothetical protein
LFMIFPSLNLQCQSYRNKDPVEVPLLNPSLTAPTAKSALFSGTDHLGY